MAIKLIDFPAADMLREACSKAVGKLDVTGNNDTAHLLFLIREVRKELTDACDKFTEMSDTKVDMENILKADANEGHTLYGNKIKISIKDATPEKKAVLDSLIKDRRVPVQFKKLDPDAKLPSYAHEGDAGMDVFALHDIELPINKPVIVKTGLAAEIPPGYEIQVRPRSGLAAKGITVWNSPGTIDSKYRGEIGVILFSAVPAYRINSGDKIAQLVISPVTFADISETDTLSETDRGTGGFGSTGV